MDKMVGSICSIVPLSSRSKASSKRGKEIRVTLLFCMNAEV